MRIGIDARLYTQTGVGRYIKNIISQLSQIDNDNQYVVYLRKTEYDSVKIYNSKWEKTAVDLPWHTVQEQLLFPHILLRDKLDIVHFPYFNVPVFYPKKFLLTIHDLIVDHFDTGRASRLPTLLYKLKRLGYKITTTTGAMRASWVTVISQTTKREAIDHYSLNPNKITVTYDALDDNFLNVVNTRTPKKLYNFPYILYVGNAYPHKNLQRLILAMEKIIKKENIHLVLAGDDEYFYVLLKEFVKKKKLSNKIHFYGNADDYQLVDLFSYAKCLIFPSLMEGFGLPNLEAIACGTLPVVSDIPVFREIWGDNLLLFDPLNVENIAEIITQAIHLNSKDYDRMVNNASEIMNKFNWKKTALQTLELYNRIYSNNE